ncbi:MAG: SurA N-terminal domain-containing protein [Rhodospirillaceae bacterium]
MIEAMRSKAASWVAKILALFLILSFAVWGIEDMVPGGGTIQNIAEVNGENISRDALNRKFQQSVNVMKSSLGNNFSARQAARLGLIEQSLDEIIEEKLLLSEIDRLKLTATQTSIRQTIFNDPRFRGPGNTIDRKAFQSFLRQSGLSEDDFVKVLGNQIREKQLLSALTSGVSAPQDLTDLLFKYQDQKRSIEIATIPYGSIQNIKDPSEQELLKYFNKNKELFRSVEYRDLSILYLNPDQFGAGMTPSEDRLQELYQNRKKAASTPERRNLSQILLLDETALTKAKKGLEEGRSFEQTAAEISGGPPQSLGLIARDELPEAVSKVAFATKLNEVSIPAKSSLGWHIIRVNSINPGKEATYTDLRPQLLNELKREMGVDEIISITAKIDDSLAAGVKLEDAANASGVTIKRLPEIDILGNDRHGKPNPSYPKSRRFQEEFASLQEGATSQIEETEDGSYFVLRVDKVYPPSIPELSTIKGKIVTAWKSEQSRTAAEKEARKLLSLAKKRGLKGAAEEMGITPKVVEKMSRFEPKRELNISEEVVSEIFRAKEKETVFAPDFRGFTVAFIREISDARMPTVKNDQLIALEKNIQQSITEELTVQFIKDLRQKAKVTINRGALQRFTEDQTGG